MFYNTKNNNIKLGKIDIDYIIFGRRNKNLVIIPELRDRLRTVKIISRKKFLRLK